MVTKILERHISPRYARLERFEKYVDGTIYDGRPDWFSPSRKVPLLQRKPCFVYPIVQIAGQSNADMCLGEGRFPEIYFGTDETAYDDQFSLTDEESEALHENFEAFMRQAKGKTAFRHALCEGQYTGTAVALLSFRNGRAKLEILKAKWCTPERKNGELVSVTIQYPYLVDYKNDEGKWCQRVMLYKRVIDTTTDTVYNPAVAPEDENKPISWSVKDKVAHGMGVCPIVWYSFMSQTSVYDDDDGHPIHEHILDELDAINYAISQRHRAALYSSDPQIIETGVRKDEEPGALGVVARPIVAVDERGHSYYAMDGNTEQARQRGPGQIWRYEDSSVKVDMLCLPGDALKSADQNVDDLRTKICEALSVILIDPDGVKYAAEVSGAALREHYKRQAERCDLIREDFAAGFIEPLVNLYFRAVLNIGEGVYLPAMAEVNKITSRFSNVSGAWFDLPVGVSWPPYFRPTVIDQQIIAQLVGELHVKNLITKRSAVEKLAAFFDVDNVDEYLMLLEKEKPEEEPKEFKGAAPPKKLGLMQ